MPNEFEVLETISRVVLKDFPIYPFVVCQEGLKFLETNFWTLKESTISMSFKNKDLRNEVNFGKISCPKCKSYNTNEYRDKFICFDCFFNEDYTPLLIREDNFLFVENGYLCRKNKTDGQVVFFHRSLLTNKVKEYSLQKKIPLYFVHVHHKNHHKNDNRLSNLEIMDKEAHFTHHRNHKLESAFETWCEKVHGYVDGDYWDDFMIWMESKGETYGIAG